VRQGLDIDAPYLATEDDAVGYLARLFPHAGQYYLKSPARVWPLQVTFNAPPAMADDALEVWQTLFTVAGRYEVADDIELLVKAPVRTGMQESNQFQEWWLERLTAEAGKHAGNIRELVWRVMQEFIAEHGGALTEPVVLEQLEALFFDLRTGIRWSVATPVSVERVARLRTLGFTDRDVLDFPGLAYRMGLLQRSLTTPGTQFTWAQVLERARAVPLLPVHEAAINLARQRAATFLAPAALRDGTALELAAAEAEVRMIRDATFRAVRDKVHPRELARQLVKQLDADGPFRDFDRIARTEIAEARNRGAFEADQVALGWDDDTLLWRPVAAVPCNGCLLLYKLPTGMPRLWGKGALEALDAQGPNRGPWREWRPRIGPTHPHCVCSPWQTYQPALRAMYERQAKQWAPTMAQRGLQEAGA
jgi:hypothetical protein